MSILDEIAKLKGLLDDGAITQEEYDAQKAKLFASEDGVKGGPTGAPRHVPGTPYANRQEDVDANRVFGIISYIFCLSLVTTFAAPKESQYARFHANQGLVLFIVETIGIIALGIAAAVSGAAAAYIFGLGMVVAVVIGIISWVFGMGTLALSIMGILNAVNGNDKPLPVIGGIRVLK